MSPRASPPVYNLEQLVEWSKSDSPVNLCHTWGVFKEELTTTNTQYWRLVDERNPTGTRIKVSSVKDALPKPKPGYVVRIHRLAVDRSLKEPMLTSAKNIVIWSAFKRDPSPITTANNPTLTDADRTRRRQLEVLFTKSLYKCKDIASDPDKNKFFDIAGRVMQKHKDLYDHIYLEFEDDTGKFVLRVYKNLPLNAFETDEHYKVASELEVGDLFVATGTKLDRNGQRLNLSANGASGRSLNLVERSSLLGTTLEHEMKTSKISTREDRTVDNAICENETINIIRPLRRSPRLQDGQQNHSQRSDSSTLSQPESLNLLGQNESQEEDVPTYTHLSDLRSDSFYNFYNIVGQVRGTPNQTKEHENWVFQLYDGSQHKLKSFFVDEVSHPIDDCVTILVYKPADKFPGETDKHINTVKRLKEGDLVIIKNVKVQFKDGRVKFEMHSNLQHGKSIDVIDKTSRFGRAIENKVTNPILDDIVDDDDPIINVSD